MDSEVIHTVMEILKREVMEVQKGFSMMTLAPEITFQLLQGSLMLVKGNVV